MIVSTMLENEVSEELRKDKINAFLYSDNLDKKFRRRVLKSSIFPVNAYKLYTSPRRNNWLILLEARNKKEINDNTRITFVYYPKQKIGFSAALLTSIEGKELVIFYTAHFFSRYAERCSIDKKGIDLIIHFFTYNYSYVFDIKENQIFKNAYITECYGSTKNGVAMGVFTIEGNVLFKTFVTYEMLKGEQIKKYVKNEKIRQEIHEET